MSELIAISVEDAPTAFALRKEIEGLGHDFAVEQEDLVVITREPSGEVRLHPQVNRVAAQAIGGTIWGAVLGAVFLIPAVGAAVGAGVGALAGKLSEAGIDNGFLEDLGRKLAPGRAAVGVLARRIDAEALNALVEAHGGTVLRAAVSDDARAALPRLDPDVLADPVHKPIADYRDPPKL